jgi:hypothetical protein
MIKPYKGRSLRAGDRVRVYRNLHDQNWSVVARTGLNRGKVVAHADELSLFGCDFIVSEAGRQRVLREKRKNVHAYVEGTFDPELKPSKPALDMYTRVGYNPYESGEFQTEKGAIKSSLVAYLDEKGRVWT